MIKFKFNYYNDSKASEMDFRYLNTKNREAFEKSFVYFLEEKRIHIYICNIRKGEKILSEDIFDVQNIYEAWEIFNQIQFHIVGQKELNEIYPNISNILKELSQLQNEESFEVFEKMMIRTLENLEKELQQKDKELLK